MFELRRDPVTGWWSAIVTDRAFEHASFTVEAAPVEGTHCRHCDEAPDDDETVRRVTLRDAMFASQMALGWCFPNAVMQYAVPRLEGLTIDVAALAMPTMLWCSANQKRV